MRRWALIFRVFVAEYMGLKLDIPAAKRHGHEDLVSTEHLPEDLLSETYA